MSPLIRHVGSALIGIAIVIAAFVFPVPMRLLLHGHSALGSVTETEHHVGRKQQIVSFTFRTPQGVFGGHGLTLQAPYVGSQVAIVYLPEDPTVAMPTDDPSFSLFGPTLFIIVGAGTLCISGQYLLQKWALERGHAKVIEHDRELLS